MIKIFFIVDNLLIGGAQRHLARLANGLATRGYSIHIISLGSNEEDLVREVSVPISCFRMDCVWKFYFWKNFIKLIKLLKKEKPLIVHTYLNTSNVFGVFAAKLAKVPVVITSRRDMGHFRSGIIGRLEKFTSRLSEKVVCVSNAVRDKVIKEEKILPEKVEVIYNGADIDKYNNYTRYAVRPTRYATVSMVASMDREKKGHFYFIKAGEKIIEKRKDVRFVLIGDGHLRPSLESYVKSKGIDGYFDFRGKRIDLTKELQNTDILVIPSESEACSNALLEAMAMGIIPVATAVEGNLEVIDDGVSGLLVEPRNPHSIAEGILKLLDNSYNLQLMSKRAREKVLNSFTLRIMVDKFEALYRKLVKNTDYKTEPRRLKVAYVVSLFPCWSETFILNEIIALSQKDVEVIIFSIQKRKEEIIHPDAKRWILHTRYVELPFMIPSLLRYFFRTSKAFLSVIGIVVRKSWPRRSVLLKNIWCVMAGCYFARLVEKERITHIHAHFANYPATVAWVISKLTGRNFTFTAHAHDIFLDKTLLKEKVEDSKVVVAISDYNRRYLMNYCRNGAASKINVVHCGIDVSYYPFCHQDKQDNIIVSVGRLVRMKGFEYLIKACGLIRNRVEYKCYIIGGGPYCRYLFRLIHKCGLEDRVMLKGVMDRDSLKDFLRKAKLFVLPSVWNNEEGQEGIPLVLIEAMALGIPVISTRISGIPELVENGKTGVLVEPENEYLLADAIENVLRNDSLLRQLSLNARRKVEEEFNVIETTEILKKIYTDGSQAGKN